MSPQRPCGRGRGCVSVQRALGRTGGCVSAQGSFARGEARLSVQRDPLHRELHRLPVDEADDLLGHQRITGQGPCERRVGEGPPAPGELGPEGPGAVLDDADPGVDPVPRLGEREAIGLVHAEERRDVHPLGVLVDAPGAVLDLVAGGQQVGMALAEGVPHLRHDRGQRAVGAVAVEVADRVEDVSQEAQVGDEHDAPARQVDAVPVEEREHVLLDRPVGEAQVVVVAERHDVAPVVAEQAQAAIELGQLVEVERVEAHPIAEDVARGRGAHVQQGALVERRPHQGAPSSRAARRPEARPSSWNPKPW